jgi:hypothetical protein
MYKQHNTLFQRTYTYLNAKDTDFSFYSSVHEKNRSSHGYIAEFKDFFAEYLSVDLKEIHEPKRKLFFDDIHHKIFKSLNPQPLSLVPVPCLLMNFGSSDDLRETLYPLTGPTLLNYYKAIQFAGNFNKDDSEAGTA